MLDSCNLSIILVGKSSFTGSYLVCFIFLFELALLALLILPAHLLAIFLSIHSVSVAGVQLI